MCYNPLASDSTPRQRSMSRYGISMHGASSLREDGADCVVLVGDVKSVRLPLM